MALSAAAHHSFDKVAAGEKYDGLRAQKTDRTGEAANKALRRQKSKAAGDAVFFELFDEDTAGVRPGVLAEHRPQERVQRHTADQIVDAVSGLPTLDVPVPQMVDQLLALLMALDSIVPEQFIKVPKISTSSRYPHTDLSLPQTGEQLVEVPTIVSHWGDQASCRANR